MVKPKGTRWGWGLESTELGPKCAYVSEGGMSTERAEREQGEQGKAMWGRTREWSDMHAARLRSVCDMRGEGMGRVAVGRR